MVLYHGGDILTMVGNSPEYVEAVVEKGGIIIFKGKLQEAREKHPDVMEKDLEGATMMPGHIDPHLHPAMASLILQMQFITPFDWKLPSGNIVGVRTETGYRERLQALIDSYDSSANEDKLLITWGYHESFHGKMEKKIMDEMCAGKPEVVPLIVWHRSFHEVYLSSAVLDNLVIRDQEKFDKCEQKDLETGNFYEGGLDVLLNFTDLGDKVMGRVQGGYGELIKAIHLGGMTTICDLEFPCFDENLETGLSDQYLRSAGTHFSTYFVPSARMYELLGGSTDGAIELIRKKSEEFSDDQLGLFHNHVKILFDGAFYSLAMQMKEPFTDGHTGEWITQPEQVEKWMRVYWNKGFQVHLHTNGDLAMEELLKIVEKLNKENPRPNHRTTVEHAGYFTEDQAQKMSELGMLVSAAPYYFYALCERYSEEGLGQERAHAMVPLKWLFDRGVPTTIHSDFTMAPSQPLVLAWSAINRITSENQETFREDLRITPYQGMLAITKNAAIILGLDEIIGTIEVGKYANFTILQENPMKVHPTAIKDIEVKAVVYKGKMSSTT